MLRPAKILTLLGIAALLFLQSSLHAKPAEKKAPRCNGRMAYEGSVANFSALSVFPLMPAGEQAPPDATDKNLANAFKELQAKTAAPALGVALARLDGWMWSKSEGNDGRLFFWASAGKSYTAVAILQLVQEKKLSLDDRIDKWFPALPNARHIAVRDLLTHRSGLSSSNEDEAWRKTGMRKISTSEEEAILIRHGALFCPGQHWRYSNSGYHLLGRIIESVDGMPYPQAIQRRIIDRLGLKETIIVGASNQSMITTPPERPDGMRDLSVAGAAGAIAASPADMLRFWSGLFAGKLINPEYRDLMFDNLYPMFGDKGQLYGAGAMVIDKADSSNIQLNFLGHAGGMPGVNVWAGYDPNRKLYFAVALTGDGSAPAVANQMLKAAAAEK
jgi:D-alanyl-D-alanine carboxypeptidase